MKTLRCGLWVLCLGLGVGCAGNQASTTSADNTSAPAVQKGTGDGELPGAASKSGAGDLSTASASAPSAAASSGPASSALPSAAAGSAGTGSAAPAGAPGSTPAAAMTASGAPPPSDPGGESAASAAPRSAASTLPEVPADSEGNGAVTPGTLTAGTWDDNRNFDRFMQYRSQLEDKQLAGLLPTTDEEHKSAHDAFAQVHGPRQTLDVSFVIDTTGSMGDELSYLQTEFKALSQTIEANYPDAAQRWSLVVYRDKGDAYVTRWYDFRDDADDFRGKLAMQSAGGGGDFPEAPDAALDAMTQLAWRTDEDTARLAFWVADAPHHAEQAQAMAEAIRAARAIDVHIYPVASSGIDEFTELTMRSAAQLTGGRYLFLTDDSGVGGAHKEPSIPCYFVTHLDKAILRMVDIELSGMYLEPDPSDIIRRGGDPQDGACTLDSGEQVQVF